LAKILYDLTKETVDYVFDDQVIGIDQSDSEEVAVTFEKDNRMEKYDKMIIADGLASRTRALAFNQEVREPVHSLHQYGAGFSFPADAKNGDSDWAKWYNAPGRRVILHRPDGFGRMRSSLVHYDSTPNTRLATSSKTSVQQQKNYWAQLFKGAGWESDRLIEAMKKSDDFYAYEVAQVKMKSWSKGRVVLIGDAASCPSPISGQGTNVAITQAYVLAAMITQHRNDHTTAFTNYEEKLRTWVEGIQKISPEGAPKLACPESKWGIGCLLAITWIGSLVMRSGIVKLLGKLFPSKEKGLSLPSPRLFGDTKA
jgi:2-polyprenyl-6-methoxyphenol hydroxylase-like FAD-dependent oxidoreductase